MIEESTVLDRDERRAYVTRHAGERHVHSADIGETPQRRPAPIEHAAALARTERLYIGDRRAPREPTGRRPARRGDDAENHQGERRETDAAPGGKGKLQLDCGADPAESIRVPASVIG